MVSLASGLARSESLCLSRAWFEEHTWARRTIFYMFLQCEDVEILTISPCADVGFTSGWGVGVGITSARHGVEPSWAVAVNELVAHLCCRWAGTEGR